jgi:aerobic-type carbon monoxide dehydrogenase small subunit (CoxS/CutS family)
MTTVGAVSGGSVTTIEGLEREGFLHPIQQAFVEESAMQCGYCIPGFIMAAVGFLNNEPQPTGVQIREALAENMCRCGTYVRIQRAVERAAEKMAEGSD